MKNISFIGLGNMGFEMAINLSKSGLNVIGFDINQEKYKQLEAKNVKCVSSIVETLNNPDVIISMLPDGKIVKNVWSQITKILNNNPLAIDCSTIDIKSSLFFHDITKKHNIQSLDAPVSGGVIGARNGSLTFMVGGNQNSYNKAQELFNVMGNKSVFCGPETSGQAIKICNNMLLAVTMIGVSESFNLAENLNVDIQKLFDVISTSSGSCWAVNNYCPIKGVGPISPVDNNFEPGFMSKLMHKDLSLAIAASKDKHTKIDFTKQAFEIFSKMIADKNGEKDFSYIKEYLK
jgi:3-hydroxyisobutyrate dehydrogenase